MKPKTPSVLEQIRERAKQPDLPADHPYWSSKPFSEAQEKSEKYEKVKKAILALKDPSINSLEFMLAKRGFWKLDLEGKREWLTSAFDVNVNGMNERDIKKTLDDWLDWEQDLQHADDAEAEYNLHEEYNDPDRFKNG